MSHAEFESAIAELRFSDARAVLAAASGEDREVWERRLRDAEEAAREAGEDLADRIQQLAREGAYPTLYELAEDEGSVRLLALVPAEIRRGAEIHLNGARRRREQSLASARRQLEVAQRALDEFRPHDAEAALARVDVMWFDEGDRASFETLRSRLDAVTAETAELASLSERVLREEGALRRSRRRGCLPAVLVLAVAVGALATWG
jgi:hypothetical protein